LTIKAIDRTIYAIATFQIKFSCTFGAVDAVLAADTGVGTLIAVALRNIVSFNTL